MGQHQRESSFPEIDHAQAGRILSGVLRESKVFLGGSSVGKGLKKAAKYYIHHRGDKHSKSDFFELPGAKDLVPGADLIPAEGSFYVLDIGVLISQVYQWRRFFPRVEPFYAVKCNPDPLIVKVLALIGCHFDCASREEIRLVEEVCKDLPRHPDIIYANPCKARDHLIEAVCKGVRMVTFDNASEVAKCAAISKNIELVLRIITDDHGSQCRLSSKFGAPRHKWRPLLAAAAKYGLRVIGVSFHVGSGCRDASRYSAALKDAREIFDIAESEFGMKMSILDIGGGFPGETHSTWNPAAELDEEDEEEDDDDKEGRAPGTEDGDEGHFMFFTEIAEQVAPVIDELFPKESGVRVIAEPGRYFVAACATLCCSVVSARSNEMDSSFVPEPINDRDAARELHELSREEGNELIRHRAPSRGRSLGQVETDKVFTAIQEELADYSMLFASQMLAQQEFDVYNDPLDLYKEGFESACDLLGPPTEEQIHRKHHTVEGMNYPLVAAGSAEAEDEHSSSLLTLAAAGEAAVNGVFLQAVCDSAPLQDDYGYYIADGVYGAFNNIMFDHASVRPRVLQRTEKVNSNTNEQGFIKLESSAGDSTDEDEDRKLYASTVFGPTCDSIDVVARSVLLPKLKIGDFLYFQNMGAYTMAAASSFNGFAPSERFYVCSVPPEFFIDLLKGPDAGDTPSEEKKEM